MVGTVGKAKKREQFVSPLHGLALLFTCDVGWYHYIFESSKLRQQLVKLEDKAQVLVAEVAQLLTR